MARKIYDGGGADGNKRDQGGYGSRPRRRASFVEIKLPPEEEALASALAQFAGWASSVRHDHATLKVREPRPELSTYGTAPKHEGRRDALKAAFTYAGITHGDPQEGEVPVGSELHKYAIFSFDPRQMLDFLESKPAQDLLKKLREHESKEQDKDPSIKNSAASTVPLSDDERAELVDLARDCRTLLGISTGRKTTQPHPRTAKHQGGGRGGGDARREEE